MWKKGFREGVRDHCKIEITEYLNSNDVKNQFYVSTVIRCMRDYLFFCNVTVVPNSSHFTRHLLRPRSKYTSFIGFPINEFTRSLLDKFERDKVERLLELKIIMMDSRYFRYCLILS